jgi:hypothetical protein
MAPASPTTMLSARFDWWLKRLIAVLFLVTCWKVWFGPGSAVQPALAQIPDSGMQRKRLLDETQETNDLLRELIRTLKTETLNVKISGTDKTSDVSPPPVAPKASKKAPPWPQP